MTDRVRQTAILARALQADADELRDRSESYTTADTPDASINASFLPAKPGSQAEPPTAFVSWAHAGEARSDEQAAAWLGTVVGFVGRLRRNGINADLDMFHTSDPGTDWTRFGSQGVEASDFVIVALSEAWAQRWAGVNHPRVGAGAVAEADSLHGLFQEDQAAWQRKLLLVLLPGQEDIKIPADLARVNRFVIDPDEPDTLDGLLRTLTGQPLYEAPELGEVPVLSPAVASALHVRTRQGQTPGYADYRALLKRVTDERKAVARGKGKEQQLALLEAVLDSLLE